MTQGELEEIITNFVKENGVTKIICDYIGYFECYACDKKNIYTDDMLCCKHCLFYNKVKSEFNRKCKYLCIECYDKNKQKVKDGNNINIDITYLNNGILCDTCYINCLSCHKCFYDIENDNHFNCQMCNGVFCYHCSDQTQFYEQMLCDFCYNQELEGYFDNVVSD